MEKYVIITGATAGIGLELTYLYAKQKSNLILIARSNDKLIEIKLDLEVNYNIKVITYTRDLSEYNSAIELYNKINSLEIIIEELVNNAGFGDFGRFYETDFAKCQKMMQLNINFLTEFTFLFLKEMVKRNSGKILNVASVAGFFPGPYMTLYYATKAFVLSFTEGLAVELKKTNIHISVLCPGPTKTLFENNANLENSDLFKLMPVASAKSVALYGFNSLKRKKIVAVHGFFNKFSVLLMGLIPRRIVRNSLGIIQGRKLM